MSLGRGPDNDIQVLVSEVSVKHGELKADGDGFKIVDLGSTNGTQVNGAKVGDGGTALSPMDKVVIGATISAYFVPTAVLAATPAEELIKNIEDNPKAAPTPGTAKVAVAAVAAPAAKPAPGVPPAAKPAVAIPVSPGAAGAATVKLEQVQPGAPAPGPAKPPGVAPAAPAAPKPVGGPPAPGAPAAAPVAPPKAAPGPPAPGGPPAPKPVSPVPLKRPGADGPAAPSVPLPGPPKVKPD